MAATYGEFRGPTYGELGQTATATYGEFGISVLLPSRGVLVLSESGASLRAAESLVEALADAEVLATALVGAERPSSSLVTAESQGAGLVVSEA